MLRSLLLSFILLLTLSVHGADLDSGHASAADPTESQEPTKKEKENNFDETMLDQATNSVKDAADRLTKAVEDSRDRRDKAHVFGLLNYSPVDLLIPGKYGVSLGLVSSADKTWELEYLRASLSVPVIVEDLGKMTDQRISLIGRSYFGSNSFNFNYGLSYFDFSVVLGDKLLNRVSGGTFPSLELLEIESAGFNLGIGNRWAFKHNITFGIDWISWSQPVFVTKRKTAFLDYASNEQDKKDVENLTKAIAYLPRLAFLKLHFGLLF